MNYNFDDNAVYNTEIRALQDSDPASATKTLNPLVENILNNIHAVKNQLEKTVGDLKSDISDLESTMDQEYVTQATVEELTQSITNEYATKTEVDELKKSVTDGKKSIATAISDKGISTAANAEFQIMANNILKIETGIKTDDATAEAPDILNGKMAYTKGKKITGMIPSVTGKTITPSTAQQTAISAGNYASGNILVSGDSKLTAANIKAGTTVFNVAGTFTDDASAVAANLLSGKTAYVKGNKVTGTMASVAGKTVMPSTVQQTAIAGGNYASGNMIVAGDSNLKAENIKKGVSIFGISGTALVYENTRVYLYDKGAWSSLLPNKLATVSRGDTYCGYSLENSYINFYKTSGSTTEMSFYRTSDKFDFTNYNMLSIIFSTMPRIVSYGFYIGFSSAEYITNTSALDNYIYFGGSETGEGITGVLGTSSIFEKKYLYFVTKMGTGAFHLSQLFVDP